MDPTDTKIKLWARKFIDRIPEPSKTTHSCSIFKVPERLNVKEDAFLPQIFPLGPLYGREHKWKYQYLKVPPFYGFFGGKVGEIVGSKTTVDIESQSPIRLDEVFNAMVDLEEETRKRYDGQIIHDDYDSASEFVETMVLDGCFVVESLRLHSKLMTDNEKNQLDAHDGSSGSPIFAARWVLPYLLRDLMKLQNQLPFFVLQKLFSLTTSGNDETSLRDLFVTFFSFMLSLNKSFYMLDPDRSPRNYAHPLDLCRSLFVFPIRERCSEMKVNSKINPQLIYSVEELQEAGVKLCRKKDSHLLDISFDKGVLKIPPLSFDENTTTFLLNFAAYEQCDRSQGSYFTNYLMFLNSLINTTKEVVILRKNGIIRYPSGSEQEVIDLLHKFCKELLSSFEQKYFLLDMIEVNKYCKAYYDSNWRMWWSQLKKERFSSPWTFLSLVAAIVLLAVAILQTLYVIIPYYIPN